MHDATNRISILVLQHFQVIGQFTLKIFLCPSRFSISVGKNLLPDLVKILFKVQFPKIIGHLIQQAAKQEQEKLQNRKQQKLLKNVGLLSR